MIKSFAVGLTFAVLAAVGPQSVNAQGEGGVETIPRDPAFCEKYDYDLVNPIFSVTKTSETFEQVTFRIKMGVASCKNRVFSPVYVDPSKVRVGISRDEMVAIQYSASSQMTDLVLSFDKLKSFEDERTIREFKMNYYPWGKSGWVVDYFRWLVVLKKQQNGEAVVGFMQQ